VALVVQMESLASSEWMERTVKLAKVVIVALMVKPVGAAPVA
jgi:hypothetical protein